MDMELKWIFDSFSEWRDYLWKACRQFIMGVLRVIYSVLMGIVSVFVWIGKLIEAFCRRETVAAIVIGFFFSLILFGWVYTFTKERSAYMTAQFKADSLSYSLGQIEQIYDSTATIVINGDTIRHGR